MKTLQDVYGIIKGLYGTNDTLVQLLNNHIVIVIPKETQGKVSVSTKSFDLVMSKKEYLGKKSTKLVIDIKDEIYNETIYNLIHEINLIIRDEFKSIKDIKKEIENKS